MTRQDIEALREMDRWLSAQYNQTNGPERNKRFGLATWVLGWGLYKTVPSNISKIILEFYKNKICYSKIRSLN